MAVGGDCNVERLTADSAQPRKFADEIHQTLAQQRFAARQPDLFDAPRDKKPRDSEVIRKRQVAVQRALIAGAAINTLVVAAIGDREPQVGDVAPEFVA